MLPSPPAGGKEAGGGFCQQEAAEGQPLPLRGKQGSRKGSDKPSFYRSKFSPLVQLSCHSAPPAGEDGELRENRVRSMATQLQAKFEGKSSTTLARGKVRLACVGR